MSMNHLKQSLIKKMDVQPSKNFDANFFEKLDKEKARPKVFSSWITWLITGCATATVLFIAITTHNVPPRHTFNHTEYIDSMLEIQDTVNDGVADDRMIDLTSMPSDEI